MSATEETIVWNESITFIRDFYKMLWDFWKTEKRNNLYLIVQYLELKKNIVPTVNQSISRKILEDKYDLIGYGVIKLNDENGKLIYGTFTVPLYNPPIYVGELFDEDKTKMIVKLDVREVSITVSLLTLQLNYILLIDY